MIINIGKPENFEKMNNNVNGKNRIVDSDIQFGLRVYVPLPVIRGHGETQWRIHDSIAGKYGRPKREYKSTACSSQRGRLVYGKQLQNANCKIRKKTNHKNNRPYINIIGPYSFF